MLARAAELLMNRWFYASRQSRRASTEHRGNDDPCHTTMLVAYTRNRLSRFTGVFYGRYWARTSDPQLVELVLSQLS